MAAVAQAVAMTEYLAEGTISRTSADKVDRLLKSAETKLSECVPSPELPRVRGKVLQTRAQLSVIAQQPVEALKALGRAREVYLELGADREVALVDALSGLAFLEASKSRGTLMLDEASSSLQRALEYFSGPEAVAIRWKLKYYLSVAAYLNSQLKNAESERGYLRTLATNWLSEAVADSELMSSGEMIFHGGSVDADFSPGLKPEVLEPLKKALGVSVKRGAPKGTTEIQVTGRSRRVGKNFH
jgi:hypothetical protein